MAIRLKNLDLKTDGMKHYLQANIGDVTADNVNKICFVAPVACTVEYIDIYSTNPMPPATLTASTTHGKVAIRLSNNSDSTLQSRGGSATASNSDSLAANTRYRLRPSSNNSLSTGQALTFNWSQGGSGVLSAVMVQVTYTPNLHRETR